MDLRGPWFSNIRTLLQRMYFSPTAVRSVAGSFGAQIGGGAFPTPMTTCGQGGLRSTDSPRPVPLKTLSPHSGAMLLTSDLAAAGASRREVEAMRSDNSKLTRGVYVCADIDPWDRHGLLAQAVLSRLRPGACITGPSAAHAWELPVPSKPPAEVTVRNIARGTYGPQIRVMHGEAEYVERNGLLVATPAWTVADCARLLPPRDALIVADAVLHEELCSEADLRAVCARLKGSRGVASSLGD